MIAPATRSCGISVIVPAFNAQAYLAECVSSIRLQAGDYWIEIVVIDDGSTDDTARIAREFPEVTLIQQENKGPAAARNRGIEASSGEMIAFLDSDDVWPPGKLKKQMEVLQRYPEVGLVFGDCRKFWQDGEEHCTFFEKAGMDAAYWGGEYRVERPYEKLLRHNFIPTGSVVARRGCLNKAGLFDESLRLVEDFDMWLRMALHCQFACIPDVALLKRRHADNISRNQVAMRMAAIKVLLKQREHYIAELNSAGIDINPIIAGTYVSLGHLQLDDGYWLPACRSLLRAVRHEPTARHCYYLIRACLFGLLCQRRN